MGRKEARGWDDSEVLNQRMVMLPGMRNGRKSWYGGGEEVDELEVPVENHLESLARSWGCWSENLKTRLVWN